MPFEKSHMSMMVHRIGKSLLLDEFDIHKHLFRQEQVSFVKYEQRHENLSLGFLTRFDTNRAVYPLKIARGMKFQILEVEGLYCLVKLKALIS